VHDRVRDAVQTSINHDANYITTPDDDQYTIQKAKFPPDGSTAVCLYLEQLHGTVLVLRFANALDTLSTHIFELTVHQVNTFSK